MKNLEFGRGKDKKKRKRRLGLSRYSPFRKSNEDAIDRANKAGQDYLNRNLVGNAIKGAGIAGTLGLIGGATRGYIVGKPFDKKIQIASSAIYGHKGLKKGIAAGLGTGVAATLIGKAVLNKNTKDAKNNAKERGKKGTQIKIAETLLGGKFGKDVKIRNKRRGKGISAVGKRGEIYL